MQGLYFLLSLVAVAVVVVWTIQADRTGPDGVYRGLLGIKPPGEAGPKPARTRKWQRSGSIFSARSPDDPIT
jgi:hypothetical protein